MGRQRFDFLIPHWLEASAERAPDAAAVLFGETRLSYADLADRTARLSRALSENGVARGDRVGLWLNKSGDSVVAVHGALRARAAYVPLDPNAPPKRLGYIVSNCGIRAVLCSARKAAELHAVVDASHPLDLVVLLDGDEAPAGIPARTVLTRRDWMSAPARAPDHASVGFDLAYILYTSGSTGEPKGVMLSHQNAYTFIDWAVDQYGVQADDVLSNHAPLHFDLSTFDLFAAAKAGAAVAPVPEGLSVFPGQLAGFIEKAKISVWYSVPSVLTALLLHGKLEEKSLGALRTVLFAGEVFPTKYLRAVMAKLPGAKFSNLYGPTETNVCTYYDVPTLPEGDDSPIPIGAACANIEVYAIDDGGARVTKPGGTGELYVRGPCVMHGYFGDPERSAKGLVQTPLPLGFPDRSYRTGDLVTLAPDGRNWLYVGRRDNQIKSRGYRIELGEIETALFAHAAVREAAVVAVPDEQIGNRILCFLSFHEGKELDPAGLQAHVLSRVPRYMLPERFVVLPDLPKTSTGKTDKQALKATHAGAR